VAGVAAGRPARKGGEARRARVPAYDDEA
jgi:hypothetical protein